ncbi:hypothetical protein JG688_00014142, partial [Phytophthora aleatoria]
MVTRTVVGATTTLTTPTNGAPTADVEDATHPLNPFANSRDGNQVMGTMMLKFRGKNIRLGVYETVKGNQLGGNFQLSFNGETTAPIAFNAEASEVETELNKLGTIKPSSVVVSRGNPTLAQVLGYTWYITFRSSKWADPTSDHSKGIDGNWKSSSPA